MRQKLLTRNGAFVLLIFSALTICFVPPTNGAPLNCTAECGGELRTSLKACDGCDTYVEEYMCKHGAYMQYGACMGVCNTVGRISHWLGYYPPGIVFYEPAEIVKVGFQRCDSTGFLNDQGPITNVDIYIIACEDIDTTVDLELMPFELLGAAMFNGDNNTWELDWNTSSYDSPGGYLIMANYLDLRHVLQATLVRTCLIQP